MNPRFAFDIESAGRATVAGADEAGRGCLAGPIVAAAVTFDYQSWGEKDFAALVALNDSKQLTPARRSTLYTTIIARARQVVVVSMAAATIDQRGLHVCNLEALRTAVERLGATPTRVFIDGFALKDCGVAHEALVRGDSRSAAVAAASIVAKVTRDRLMQELHRRQPQWAFDVHMGYATPLHHERILAHGVSVQHRLSFQSVAYRQLGLDLERR